MAIVTSWNYTTLSAAWTAGEEQIKLNITENKKKSFFPSFINTLVDDTVTTVQQSLLDYWYKYAEKSRKN